MLLNQINSTEAEILAYLINEEKKHNIFVLDEADYSLERIFEHQIFSRCNTEAIYQAECVSQRHSEDRLNTTKENLKTLINYKIHLQENKEYYELSNRKMLKKIKRLKNFSKSN